MNSWATVRFRVVAAGCWDLPIDYMRVCVNDIEVFAGTSYHGYCLDGFTAYDSVDAAAFEKWRR